MGDPESREQVGREGKRLAYRPAELARLVGLSCKAIYRAIERGELGAARVAAGSRLLIPVAEAESWLERSVVDVDRHPSVPAQRQRSRKAQGLRPLSDAIAELDLDPADGSDRDGERHGGAIKRLRASNR